jgi:hypothetical protein
VSASGPYGQFAWTYDAVGNRLTESLTSGGTTTARAYAYPAASNRMSGVAQGGLTVRSFGYDVSVVLTAPFISAAEGRG